ncbi:MAG: radical SAM protein [Desulfobacteraceae bacterium]|nr:radical SAM protein [Desulfobacteraceae bacterium]
MLFARTVEKGHARDDVVFPHQDYDLSWVDEWIANVRDYIHVRAEDNVFIQRPNKAFHLNDQGIDIVKSLIDGKSIRDILVPYGPDPRIWRDTWQFLTDLRKLLKDGLQDTYESSAVEKIPCKLEFSRYPILSEVAVTYRCNARCLFCYAGCGCRSRPGDDQGEMSLSEIKTVLHRIYHQAKVPSVSFTGGEPTLRADLPEVIRYARSLGMRVNLITNGILSTAGLVKRLKTAGLHSAQVSIEGITAPTHERLTCVAGSFQKAIEAVQRYQDAGLTVHTNTTLTRLNLKEAERFPEFVKETLQLDTFSMNLMIPEGSGAENKSLAVSYVELGPVIETLLAAANRQQVDFKWYSPIPMCMFNLIVHGLGNKGCAACDGLISVNPRGEILPCASFDDPTGSLLHEGFEKIWRSGKATAYRLKTMAHTICKSCEHFHICHGACALYWRNMGYEELIKHHRPGKCPNDEKEG